MKLLAEYGKTDLASVYVGETIRGNIVEFVQSLQPPLSRSEKWVLIVSTMNGCPVGCKMCDAGGFYKGKLTADEILEQIDFLVLKFFPEGIVRTKKFKVQFARVGEPALNEEVLIALEQLSKYDNLLPSVSTIAPAGCDRFFEELLNVKNRYYRGRFQLQFSIHSTDERQRDELMPVRKWTLEQIAEFGENFVEKDDRKITLNFALSRQAIVESSRIIQLFSPDKFLIKITPVNPTYNAVKNNIVSDVDVSNGMPQSHASFVKSLVEHGFEVILSVGELEENNIGSNCGQYVSKHLSSLVKMKDAYTYVK
ncbi:radical SAM protein [Pseudothermotoga sp.]|nr:radical SAM protein [Pseudothermotoga sp.]MDW8140172.1 radical SAM protein [Pseudothermotoga sp.]